MSENIVIEEQEFDTEEEYVCEHNDILEQEFDKRDIITIKNTIMITNPTTINCTCQDCGEEMRLFVMGGMFKI